MPEWIVPCYSLFCTSLTAVGGNMGEGWEGTFHFGTGVVGDNAKGGIRINCDCTVKFREDICAAARASDN